MTDNPADLIPMWMFFAAVFGFVVGDLFGDATRKRKCLEETNDELRAQLEQAPHNDQLLRNELKQQRGLLNDIHKQVTAVTKGLSKRPS